MGLNEAEEREYRELCDRERELMHAPALVDLVGGGIDLDADFEREPQRQDR